MAKFSYKGIEMEVSAEEILAVAKIGKGVIDEINKEVKETYKLFNVDNPSDLIESLGSYFQKAIEEGLKLYSTYMEVSVEASKIDKESEDSLDKLYSKKESKKTSK